LLRAIEPIEDGKQFFKGGLAIKTIEQKRKMISNGLPKLSTENSENATLKLIMCSLIIGHQLK